MIMNQAYEETKYGRHATNEPESNDHTENSRTEKTDPATTKTPPESSKENGSSANVLEVPAEDELAETETPQVHTSKETKNIPRNEETDRGVETPAGNGDNGSESVTEEEDT